MSDEAFFDFWFPVLLFRWASAHCDSRLCDLYDPEGTPPQMGASTTLVREAFLV